MRTNRDTGAGDGTSGQGKRLDTWKEIGAYFGKDARTAKRWEQMRGLPVHRVPGAGRANVYAYEGELAEWLRGASVAPGEVGDRTAAAEIPADRKQTRKVLLTVYAVALLIFACGVALTVVLRQRAVAARRTGSGATKRPVDPAAEALYLKGIYYWHKRTPEGLHDAVDYFTQAVVRDPKYAEAYVGLANCYNLMREYTLMPGDEAYARATAAAERAVALDEGLSSGHSALGFAEFYGSWEIAPAEKEFRRALELDGRSVVAHHWYATYLMSLGRFPEASKEIATAQKLDPESSSILADRGLILFYAGQAEDAVRLLQQLESSEPEFLSPHNYLAVIYLSRGEDRKYLEESRRAAELLRDEARAAIAGAGERGLNAAGSKGMLEKMLKVEQPLRERGQLGSYQLAETYALLGKKQNAIDALQLAYANREAYVLNMNVDPAFKTLHGERAFQKIGADVGLPVVP